MIRALIAILIIPALLVTGCAAPRDDGMGDLWKVVRRQ